MNFKGDKPVVRYFTIGDSFIELNQRASVIALDHPILGRELVSTSKVIGIIRNNEGVQAFETLNTIYVLDTYDISEH